jgi:hypothetical protein
MANTIPDLPISSRAAWLGVEQTRRSDGIHILSGAENLWLTNSTFKDGDAQVREGIRTHRAD